MWLGFAIAIAIDIDLSFVPFVLETLTKKAPSW